MKIFITIIFCTLSLVAKAQDFSIEGKVTIEGKILPYANVYIENSEKGVVTDKNGYFKISNLKQSSYTIIASFIGYTSQKKNVTITNKDLNITFHLSESKSLDEVTISGTLKPISREESPIPVEMYSSTFLKKNPTSNIFEALQNVNGVRPQLNCSVCNTGDIRINGLEGPYTMVLIDGTPIVSGLSSVYGLSGIPNSLIEQIEIIKGPASSLYGSEALGGLINVITKLPENSPKLSFDTYGTSWKEINLDLSFKTKIGKNIDLLIGSNYFNYNEPIDLNNDNFTDVPIQKRVSVFQKWNFKRKENKKFSLSSRYFHENRWGGELQWTPSFRGGNQIYGESIYTSRFEIIGNYQLPIKENINLQFSFSDHDQNSAYGNTIYLAQQRIGFSQITYNKNLKKNNDLLLGIAARYNYYNDNTTATDNPNEIIIPSLFVQNSIKINNKTDFLAGIRYDYDNRHGSILTPRLAYKYKSSKNDIIRINAGTGFRVVNLFTEEHAALTGARDVVIKNNLDPEESYNITLNYLKKVYLKNNIYFNFDSSIWYTYFTNAIIPDYDTNPNQIIYDNLNGHSSSKGLSFNVDAIFGNSIKGSIGGTYQNVTKTENNITTQQILTENFSGTWNISYKNFVHHLTFDYTGNIYGPMRLPIISDLDPRKEYSPTWSIQNIQITYDNIKNLDIYIGVKNLLNWTPNKDNPFIIARAHDPFDNNVEYDSNGNIKSTIENPYALTFDPTYMYAPNQGIRGVVGVRYKLN